MNIYFATDSNFAEMLKSTFNVPDN